jgi:septin family protein
MFNNVKTFVHPFTALIAGPTGSGKTQFVVELLQKRKDFISPTPQRLIYCFSIWQDKFDHLKKIIPSIEFNEGLCDVMELNSKINKLMVLDDLMIREINLKYHF